MITGISKPLEFTWSKLSDYLIDTSHITEDFLIYEVSKHVVNFIYDQKLSNFLDIFDDKETHYYDKVDLFMRQTRRTK